MNFLLLKEEDCHLRFVGSQLGEEGRHYIAAILGVRNLDVVPLNGETSTSSLESSNRF
jgi:hypothetical protein